MFKTNKIKSIMTQKIRKIKTSDFRHFPLCEIEDSLSELFNLSVIQCDSFSIVPAPFVLLCMLLNTCNSSLTLAVSS